MVKRVGCRTGEILIGNKCVKDKPIMGVPVDVHFWLERYVFGPDKEIGKIKLIPSDKVIMRSSRYVPSQPSKLYRAEPKKDTPKRIVSYTRNKKFAEHLVEYSDNKLVLKSKKINPDEIVLDTTLLPKQYSKKYMPSMDEVVVARGKLKDRLKDIRKT